MAANNEKLGAAMRTLAEKLKALQSASMMNAKDRASDFATASVEAVGALGVRLLDMQDENTKLAGRIRELESRQGIRHDA